MVSRARFKKYTVVFVATCAFVFVTLFVPQAVSTKKTLGDHGSGLETVVGKSGIDEPLVENVVGNFIGSALTLVSLLFLILMVYAGIRWMVARGNEEAVTKARNTILGAIIGLIITVSGYAITNLVTTRIIGGDGAPPLSTVEIGSETGVCCILPSTINTAEDNLIGDLAISSKYLLTTVSKCQEGAKKPSSPASNPEYFTKGYDWDVYPQVKDQKTCAAIHNCWQKFGKEEASCIQAILSNIK